MKLDPDTIARLKQQGLLPADFAEEPKPSRYRNKPVVVDGVRYASGAEYRRWAELCLLQKAGAIRCLERQVSYRLEVNGVLVGKYTCDATYIEVATGEQVVEDTKSPATRKDTAYRLRRQLMRAIHGIEIREA